LKIKQFYVILYCVTRGLNPDPASKEINEIYGEEYMTRIFKW